MSLLENTDLGRRSVFRLTISGLPVRYYSGPVTPSLDAVPGTALFYSDQPGLTGVGAVSSKLDPKGGIAENGPMSIELATSTDVRDPDDPGRVLTRQTKRAASFWAQLLTALPQASGGGHVVEIDRSHAAVTVPTLIHIGLEAMWATGKAGTGTAIDPYRFTGVTRAVAETRAQVHIVDAGAGDVPLVISPEVTNWRTRRARVEMAQVRSDGTLSAWIEIKPGFIDASPVKRRSGASGQAVQLEIIDRAALLDNHLVNNNVTTGLRQGWHEWTYPFAATIQHGQRWKWQGDASTVPHGPTAGGAGVYNVANGDLGPHQGTMDVALAGEHPRRGQLWNANGGAFELVTGYVTAEPPAPAGQDQFLIAAPGPTRLGVAGDRLNSAPAVEVITADVAPGPAGTKTLSRWPAAAVDAAQALWTPRTHLGVAGAWMNVTLALDDEDGPALLVSHNVDNYNRPPFILLWSDARAPRALFALPEASFKDWRTGSPEDPADLYRHLWYGLDFAAPGETAYPVRHITQGRAPLRGPRRNEWTRDAAVVSEADTGRLPNPTEHRISIRGVADAFYQTGEPSILASDRVIVPAGGVHRMEVTYWDGFGDTMRTHAIDVTASTEVFDGPTSIGWRLDIAAPFETPSFGDWPGQEPARIQSVVRFDAERPTIIILQLLLSGGGGLINDPVYDVLPIGANLVMGDVDVASFERWGDTPGIDRWTLTYPDGETVRDVLEDMLTAIGAAIVSRIDPETGARRLTLVSVGPENPMETLRAVSTASPADDIDRTIADGDWLADPIPESGTDDEVTNKWVFVVNHAEGDDAEGQRVVVNDKASISRHGDGLELELNLRGIVVDPSNPGGFDAATASLAARLRTQFGDPRRTWAGDIPTGRALLGHLGAVYMVGSRFLESFGDVGITAITTGSTSVAFNAGRVIQETVDYWGEGAQLVLEHYGINGSGWAASAEVTTVVNPTTITVDFSDFTPPAHPVTGEVFRDIHGFFGGQAVQLFPPADRDAAVALTIASTDGVGQIVFSAPHGAAPGDILIPGAYDLVVNRLYAHLADAAGTLGAAADPAKEIT